MLHVDNIGDLSAGKPFIVSPQVIAPRVIALDETAHYTIDKRDKPYIKAILGIYLFDANVRTHVCSFTPSYWLVHLSDRVEFTRKGNLLSDEDQNLLFEQYEYCGGEDAYVTCGQIDGAFARWISKKLAFRAAKLEDEPVPDDCTYDDAFEGVREYCQGNSPL